MQKNDTLTLEIVDLGMDGEGIAKPEGFIVFVPGALTGEKVEAKILKVNKNFAFARLQKILTVSPDRVEPPCAVFHKCGGCALMHTSYASQKARKRQAVANCFAKAGISADIDLTVESEKTLGYRNKLQLPVTPQGIGFFRENSHDIVDIDICPVVGDDSQKIISAVREYLKKSGDTAYDETAASGNIRHAVLRSAGEQKFIIFVVAEGKLKDQKLMTELLKKRFGDFGFYININRKRNNVILGEEYRHIYGREFLEGETLSIKYKITPDIFLQINDGIAAQIYQKAAAFLKDSHAEAVIDAYSGISILSAVIARSAERVWAIEINPESHAAAEELKRENDVKNLTNICGDTAVELPKILTNIPEQVRTAVILDPPRKGCDAAVLDEILASRPDTIVYISCNPATLARDLRTLSPAYEIASATPYDMFPQTKHVETLVCLTLKD